MLDIKHWYDDGNEVVKEEIDFDYILDQIRDLEGTADMLAADARSLRDEIETIMEREKI